MKAKLIFDLPEDEEEYQDATNGSKYKIQLDEIWNKVFRPYYKHGYSKEIEELIKDLPEDKNGNTIIDKLADIYNNICDGEF